MFKKSSITALRQKITQLETLGNDELNQLLNQLEREKTRLPVEKHPIIDWGISMVKAKMQEESQFKHQMDEKWEQLKQRNNRRFMQITEWTDSHRQELYKSGWDNLYEIVRLSCYEGRIRSDFPDSINQVTTNLRNVCFTQGEMPLFSQCIKGYIETCKNNTEVEFKPYYKSLKKVLEKIET